MQQGQRMVRFVQVRGGVGRPENAGTKRRNRTPRDGGVRLFPGAILPPGET